MKIQYLWIEDVENEKINRTICMPVNPISHLPYAAGLSISPHTVNEKRKRVFGNRM